MKVLFNIFEGPRRGYTSYRNMECIPHVGEEIIINQERFRVVKRSFSFKDEVRENYCHITLEPTALKVAS